jgi:hypothetical protein
MACYRVPSRCRGHQELEDPSSAGGSGFRGSPAIRYSPSAHRARSISLQRSLQKGRYSGSTGRRRHWTQSIPGAEGTSVFYGMFPGDGMRDTGWAA